MSWVSEAWALEVEYPFVIKAGIIFLVKAYVRFVPVEHLPGNFFTGRSVPLRPTTMEASRFQSYSLQYLLIGFGSGMLRPVKV